jgi:hypothetical protein
VDPKDYARALELTLQRPVLVVIGGAGAMEKRGDPEQVREMLARGLVPRAVAAKATVITGGTDVGLMSIVGDLLGARDEVTLVGVAPADCVDHGQVPTRPLEQLEPHHDRFLLSPGDTWGSETETLFDLAERLVGTSTAGVVLFANGGEVARYETQRFIAGGWPIIVLEQSGGEADVLITALSGRGLAPSARRQVRAARKNWGDVTGKDIEVQRGIDGFETLLHRLAWRLSDQLLLQGAWSRYAAFNADAKRNKWRRLVLQWLTAAASVSLVLLSLLNADVFSHESDTTSAWRQVLQLAVVALPVGLAVAVAVGDTLGADKGWVALRAAAETTLHELYRYRAGLLGSTSTTRQGRRPGPRTIRSPEEDLANSLRRIDQQVIAAGVALAVSRAPSRSRPEGLDVDDELERLTARAYIKNRVDRQLLYYRNRATRIRRWELAGITTGTVLAATASAIATTTFALWVALLVFVASVLTILRQRARLRERLHAYGQAVADLEEVRAYWARLAPSQRGRADVLRALVAQAEDALQRETMGWVQSLNQSLEEIRASPYSPTGA